MNNIFRVGKVRHGEKWHAYEENGDKLSLCGRTPMTETYSHKDLTQVTCDPCTRLLAIVNNAVQHAILDVKQTVQLPILQPTTKPTKISKPKKKVGSSTRSSVKKGYSSTASSGIRKHNKKK